MMLDMHPSAGLSDDVRLGVLTEWVTADLVDEVLAECGKRDQKPGALPARFMVYYGSLLPCSSRTPRRCCGEPGGSAGGDGRGDPGQVLGRGDNDRA